MSHREQDARYQPACACGAFPRVASAMSDKLLTDTVTAVHNLEGAQGRENADMDARLSRLEQTAAEFSAWSFSSAPFVSPAKDGEVQELRAEIALVDYALNIGALDRFERRAEKIYHAIAMAKRGDELQAENAELRRQLQEQDESRQSREAHATKLEAMVKRLTETDAIHHDALVTRQAKIEALKPDAELGALVRQMPAGSTLTLNGPKPQWFFEWPTAKANQYTAIFDSDESVDALMRRMPDQVKCRQA